jgi:hypothetical protein
MESIEELAKKATDLANQRDDEFEITGDFDRFEELDEQVEEIIREVISRGGMKRFNELVHP